MRYNLAIIGEVSRYFAAPRKGGNRRMSEESKVSKAQQRAVNKYVKANYDRVNVTFPKGRKEELKAPAQARGESVHAFINRAITETLERDNGR